MPRFLHPDNPSLNLYVSAKKRVVKRNLKKYEGMDAAYQKELSNLAQAQEGASVIFDDVLTLFTNIEASLLEMKTTLDLAGTAGGRLGFADRFLAANSELVKLITKLRQQMQKLNYSFNIFSPLQIKELYSKYASIANLYDLCNYWVDRYSRRRNGAWVKEEWDSMSSRWAMDWNEISPRILDGLQTYKYGLGDVSGAGRRSKRSDRVIGGTATALRIGLDNSVPTWKWSPFPPRARFDREDLPYRFI
jgi:hypothetical protein